MRVLLTGANGYIGMRLLPALIEAGHEVICCVRDLSRFAIDVEIESRISVAQADFLDSKSLDHLPKDIDAAYFLIHSMSDSSASFSQLETDCAQNFVSYINGTDAKRIVYLGGILSDVKLSEHLESRQNVEHLLSKAVAPLTVLRAGIIVGSGSASFEIIRDLVEKLPVMIAPRWVNTMCQPIAIRNVVGLLKGALEKEQTLGKRYDIGGPEVLSYKDMLLQFAEVRGLARKIITVPVLTPRLSSLWLYFVTATSYNLAKHLVDSMKIDVIATPNNLQSIIPLDAINYKTAVSLAFTKIEQNLVLSSWKDAVASSGSTVLNIDHYIEVPSHGCYRDIKKRKLNRPDKEILDNIWKIGGDQGWYYGTPLWKIRGILDKFFGGIGLRRGRRSPTEIYPGDALDFWRVIIASRVQKRLLLYAEMKLPGEAWLEFRIISKGDLSYLKQTATFRPRGLWGRLYWYTVWPFHLFVFTGMINKITAYGAERAKLKKTQTS